MVKYSYVGKDVPRLDAIEKVTGTAIYTGDLRFPGLLHTKLLKSPHAHAKILLIDTSEAAKLPGVRAILTGDEAKYRFGIYMSDKTILAVDKVRHVGEPVAAVAADTDEIAERAVELIKVEYEQLPGVFDVNKARKESTVLVHENLKEYRHAPFIYPQPGTNIANHMRIRKGDVEQGFKEADFVVEKEYYQPQVQNVQMETHTCVGQWLPDGQINVWTSAQSPFAARQLLAVGLDVPLHKVNVVVPYLGGGFGGKAGLHWEPLAVLLSKKAGGRPVRIVMTREEQFYTTAVRQGFYAKIKMGLKRDGKVTAAEYLYVWDAGAYADYGVNITRAAGYACTGPYEIPNLKCDSITVYTNHPYGTAYRGFGHPEFHFATERHMDFLAREIGMDPVEFRLINAATPGKITATGVKLGKDVGRVDKCIKAVAKAIGWKKKYKKEVKGKLRGKGIAALWKAPAMPSYTSSSAILRLNEDGSATLSISSTEMGQGTPTALAQMIADGLQMPIEKIKVVTKRETDFGPYTWQTVASRGLFMEGNATLDAVRDLKERVKETASKLLGVAKSKLEVAEERVFVKGEPEKGMPLSKLAAAGILPDGRGTGGPILGYGVYTAENLTNLDPETGQGNPALKWTFGAQGVEVEVDPETGDVRVLKIASAFDLGKMINPLIVKGQAYGGIVQGIGSALMEEFIYDEKGELLNKNLTDYKICRVQDIPDEFVFIPIENPQKNAPHGARGIGEHPRISIEPAIANAVYDAVGVDMFEIPMNRERVWRAIRRKGDKRAFA